MNVKFSRELKKTNDEFCLVFNDTESTVVREIRHTEQELESRRRQERLEKFKKEYAHMELTRIVTCLIQEQAERMVLTPLTSAVSDNNSCTFTDEAPSALRDSN